MRKVTPLRTAFYSFISAVGIILGGVTVARVFTPNRTAYAGSHLADATRMIFAIDSETDALPRGKVRQIWHPSIAAIEDARVRHAEELYRRGIGAVGRELVRALERTRAAHYASRTPR
jgi:hypothetical protein